MARSTEQQRNETGGENVKGSWRHQRQQQQNGASALAMAASWRESWREGGGMAKHQAWREIEEEGHRNG